MAEIDFLAQSRLAVDAGLAWAIAEGLRMTFVVMDVTGTVCAAARMDHSRPVTYRIAVAKANTARLFENSTAVLKDRVKPENKMAIGQIEHDIAFLGGGLPLLRNGLVIGGLGASGGNEDQDIAAAEAMLAPTDLRG